MMRGAVQGALRALLRAARRARPTPAGAWRLAGRRGGHPRSDPAKRRRVVAAVGALVAVAPPVLLGAWAWRAAGQLDLTPGHDTVIVYAAGRRLDPGLAVDRIDLAGTLRRLGYRELTASPREPGQFRRGRDAWEIFLRAWDDPRGPRPPVRIRLALESGRVAAVTDAGHGRALEGVELEPEILTGPADAAGHRREPVRLDAVPRHLVSAVLAVEDHRFFEHRGIDLHAVGRAFWVNLRRGEIVQGGSTLTQQLIKNVALNHHRTWDRKLREAALALALEARVSKTTILEAYLNAVYLGQHGNAAIYGMGAAARSYFGKDLARLGPGETALLAGMIRAPNTYSPAQNPERARQRRQVVLERMRQVGLMDETTFARVSREPLGARTGAPGPALAPYFLDYVRARMEQGLGEAGTLGRALRVYTTLDPVLQRAAETALHRGLDRLETRHRHLRRHDAAARLQGALVALEPGTGEIRALVGGRDYAASQWNRAVHARRQPGSAFKPFVYLAALAPGGHGEPPRATPTTRIEDRPLTLDWNGATWSPRNFEDRFEGVVSVRRALEQSLNAATVRLALDVGLDRVIRTARAAGFTSPLEPVPALALGSFEVAPLELATAYAALAGLGTRARATPLREIRDRDGVVLTAQAARREPALDPAPVFVLTHLLQGVVERGTASAARDVGIDGAVAGKTGTANDGRDAWFVGFTPRLVTLVWVGFDGTDVTRLSGGQAALPIWTEFMLAASAVVPGASFPVPPTVTFRDIDPANGRLATAFCPVTAREAFLVSTEPHEACTDHGPGPLLRGWWQRIRDAFRGTAPDAPAENSTR
jgi:penicillin-binding protein 1B